VNIVFHMAVFHISYFPSVVITDPRHRGAPSLAHHTMALWLMAVHCLLTCSPLPGASPDVQIAASPAGASPDFQIAASPAETKVGLFTPPLPCDDLVIAARVARQHHCLAHIDNISPYGKGTTRCSPLP
jgi:hypothetical protein